MRDHKLTVEPGLQVPRDCVLRSLLCRSVSGPGLELRTERHGGLELFDGLEFDLDQSVQGFDLVNTSDAAVQVHLVTAGAATIGSKKNGADSTPHVDQSARDAAAGAQVEVDAVELEAQQALADAAANRQLIEGLHETQPFSQILRDSGRFIGIDEPHTITTTAAYNTSLCYPYLTNCLNIGSEKFTHNNSTNGGTAAALSPVVVDLLTAMGRVGGAARYGVEFFVSRRQMKAAPTVAPRVVGAETYYLANVGLDGMLGFDGVASFAMWVRADGEKQLLLRAVGGNQVAYVDGVEQSHNNDIVLPAGWHHVSFTAISNIGYGTALSLYAVADAAHDIVVPVMSRSNTKIPIHTAPVIFQ